MDQERFEVLQAAHRRGDLTVYLAAPFFNLEQVAVLETLEALLTEIGVPFWSPRLECMLNAEKTNAKECFDTDLRGISLCSVALMRVDDFDPGTMWEWGYCWSQGKMILGYTTHDDRGLNVMLSVTSAGFLHGFNEIRRCLEFLLAEGHLPSWVKLASTSE
jgi:nucleoside 2-deoxyribosyltransferase